MNGADQRKALTAAEQAIRALGAGEADRAREAAGRAEELDQLGVYAALVPAVAAAADDLDTSGSVSDRVWDAIATAVGPGPLTFEVESLRGEGHH